MSTAFKYRQENLDEIETIVSSGSAPVNQYSKKYFFWAVLFLSALSVALLITTIALAVVLGSERSQSLSLTFSTLPFEPSTSTFVYQHSPTTTLATPAPTTCKPCKPCKLSPPCPSFCTTRGCLQASSLLIRNRNTSYDPCTDFYSYACNGWELKHELNPSELERTVQGEMSARNSELLHKLLQTPIDSKNNRTFEYKVKTLYKSCINDFETMKAVGNPLTKIVKDAMSGGYLFGNWNSSWNFPKAIQRVVADYWTQALFAVNLRPVKATDGSAKFMIEVGDGGLGMHRFTYRWPGKVAAYRRYMDKVVHLLMRDSGMDYHDNTSKQIVYTFVNDTINFEMKLASIPNSLAVPSLRKRLSLSTLSANYSTVFARVISSIFSTVSFNNDTHIIVASTEYLQQVALLINDSLQDSNSGREIHNYLAWRLMHSYLEYLSWEYVHAKREFDSILRQTSEFPPLWTTCFNFVSAQMEDAVSALFVRHYSQSRGQRNRYPIHEMISRLKSSFKQSIISLKWMDDETKMRAWQKLGTVLDKVRFPERLLREDYVNDIYKDLTIKRDEFFHNVLQLKQFERSLWNQQLHQTINRMEWKLRPYDAKVKYDYEWNQLVVPAGILQVPAYEDDLPYFFNYGALGSTIARELIHSVDETGRYYSKSGTVDPWWSKATLQGYTSLKSCMEAFYRNQSWNLLIPSSQRTMPHVTLRISQVAQDAIGEIGGVKLAYKAYKEWVKQTHGEPLAPGLSSSNDRAFFLSYAQSRCRVRQSSTEAMLVMSGKIPEDLLTNTALMQTEEFSKAFGCSLKARMNPQNRCETF